MVLKLGHIGKYIRNICNFFKRGAGRSEIPGKVEKLVLENDGEDQLCISCDKLKSVTYSRGQKYHTYNKKRKAKWIGHILRRNCLLEHFIGKKDRRRYRVLGRQGRRRKQLLFDLKEAREYCKLKEETVDRAVRRTHFGRGYGPVVRQRNE